MGWVRLDDNFADHPKVIALSDSAFRIYINALCYSNRQLTDGFIPSPVYSIWASKEPNEEPADALIDADLWEVVEGGYLIRSYEEYQPTREKVETKRAEARERLKRYRDKQGNANETQKKRQPQPNPTQPNPNSLDIDISKEVEPYESASPIPLPRVKSAYAAVERISNTLDTARANGVNAWNLTKLVEDEFDKLQANNEKGACIGLTVWYVSYLQQRQLTSADISRIGQMITRFGRIALLAIDEAASKDLEDLVSYAFRIAQRMYADRKA